MDNESHRVFSLGSVLTGLNCVALKLKTVVFLCDGSPLTNVLFSSHYQRV